MRTRQIGINFIITMMLAAGLFMGCKEAPKPEIPAPENLYTLVILHTNDTHARILQFDSNGNNCSDAKVAAGQCFGGVARRATIINQVRADNPNVILVDAGDQFQGTLFYTFYKGAPMAKFMNMLGYNVMTFGNHEFDDGPLALADFLKSLDFPMVSSNVSTANEPILAGLVKPYEIMEIGGRKVGIIGYTTPDVPELSKPGDNIIFEDIDSSVVRAVSELQAQNVNIIIALSHAGFARDMELATSVAGVDVIVGGHTHTLLSNTDPSAAGQYPMMVTSPADEPVLVVTAQAWGKYLGELEVKFDDGGVVEEWEGNPVLLDSTVPEEPVVLSAAMAEYAGIEPLTRQNIGSSSVVLGNNDEVCRYYECELGDLVTDAMLWEGQSQGVQLAFYNGGGLRAGLDSGDISLSDVLTVLPFRDALSVFSIVGEDIRADLEISVGRAESSQNEGTGRFLQVSGLSYTWDPTKPVGSRIVDIQVLNIDGTYSPLVDTQEYKATTTGYLRSGGDGHTVFRDKAIEPYDFGRVLSDVVIDYIGQFSPVNPVDGDRIRRVGEG
jgi:5'-nucleotidase / UDP-sugar diphosphatase